MASLTWWTWVWVGSGSWWWSAKPGMLPSMGSQRVGHEWGTELKWTELTLKGDIMSLILVKRNLRVWEVNLCSFPRYTELCVHRPVISLSEPQLPTGLLENLYKTYVSTHWHSCIPFLSFFTQGRDRARERIQVIGLLEQCSLLYPKPMLPISLWPHHPLPLPWCFQISGRNF